MSNKNKVVFFGTADFGIPALTQLARFYEVAVVSKPAKPAGRGLKTSPNPITAFATQNRLALTTPTDLADPAFLKWLKVQAAGLNVVIAYGKKLPPAVLATAPSVNFHGSLLPRWQGASPIHHSILNGDKTSGITAILMNHKIDAGDIIHTAKTAIAPTEDFGSLYKRLSLLCGEMICSTLAGFLDGSLKPYPQMASQSNSPPESPTAPQRTLAPLIKTADTFLDWHQPATTLERKVRGYSPFPSARCIVLGKQLKVLKATALPDTAGISPPKAKGEAASGKGETQTKIGELAKTPMAIRCGSGYLRLEEVKPQGKAKMGFAEFLRGLRG